MKKILLPIIGIVMIFSLTGCGKETLSCSMSKTQSGMELKQDIVANFVNNEVTTMNTTVDVTVDEKYAKNMDQIKKTLSNQYKQYEENGGKVTISNEGNTIKVAMEFDLKSMTESQKSKLNMVDTKGSKKATEELLEKQGYTCK